MRVLTLALVTVPGVYLLQWGSGCFAKSLRSWLSFTALAKEIFFPSELLILLQEWLIWGRYLHETQVWGRPRSRWLCPPVSQYPFEVSRAQFKAQESTSLLVIPPLESAERNHLKQWFLYRAISLSDILLPVPSIPFGLAPSAVWRILYLQSFAKTSFWVLWMKNVSSEMRFDVAARLSWSKTEMERLEKECDSVWWKSFSLVPNDYPVCLIYYKSAFEIGCFSERFCLVFFRGEKRE